MEHRLESDLARSREWIYALGDKTLRQSDEASIGFHATTPPPGFPSVPVDTITFTDWSGYVEVPGILIARASSAADVVAVCNWAAQNGFRVRAVGQSHNWSPLVMAKDSAPGAKVVLVDTTKLTSSTIEVVDGSAFATFGPGITIDAATDYLQLQDNGGTSPAPGFALPHTTAPGNLTLGGVLAIGGHGTLLPTAKQAPDDPDIGRMGASAT